MILPAAKIDNLHQKGEGVGSGEQDYRPSLWMVSVNFKQVEQSTFCIWSGRHTFSPPESEQKFTCVALPRKLDFLTIIL